MMMKAMAITLLMLAFLSLPLCAASPGYPLEALLHRADTVAIGRISSLTDREITFNIERVLRGHEVALGDDLKLKHYNSWVKLPAKGDSFFILSQGDEYYGQPQSIISMGQPVKAQVSYCGWIMLPIVSKQALTIVDLVYSSKLGTASGNLTFNQVLKLVEEEPYNHRINGAAGSLEILVTPGKQPFRIDEPQQMTITFKNPSAEIVTIPTFSGWNQTNIGFLGYFVLDFVIYRLEGKNKIEIMAGRPGASWLDFPDPGPQRLKPGEGYSVTVDLGSWLLVKSSYVVRDNTTTFGRLTSGEYQVIAVYDVSNLVKILGSEGTRDFIKPKYLSEPKHITVD